MVSIQSLNSASLMNTVLSGYTQMNQVRLAQALSGGTVSSVGKVTSSTYKNQLSQEDSDFLKKYQSQMTQMLSAAEGVLTPQSSRLAAASEDSSVAEVRGSMKKASDRYELTVERLASGQINRSQALQSGGGLPSIGGALSITTEKGRYDFSLSSAGAKTNEEALQNFAAKINAAKAGVTASVVTKDGLSTLELTSDKTGAASSFTVSGTLAERLGLDQAARQGQDAVYTISKNGEETERVTSASNSVTLESGLTATLKGTGTTTVRAGGSAASSMADAMEKLVDSFNSTLSFLNDNADKGIGVLQQMKRMVVPPASEGSMNLIGIGTLADGTLTFDRSAFVKALTDSPSLMRDIAENVAEGVRADARQGMNTASADLLSSTAMSQRQLSYNQDPLNFLSAYNRNGVYNLLNYYAVGTLMNINI